MQDMTNDDVVWRTNASGTWADALVAFSSTRRDLVDTTSERRRAATKQDGVPYETCRIRLLKPGTMMNRSGSVVKAEAQALGMRLKSNMQSMNHMDELVVVTDDVNMPFGHIKMKPGGGHGGHNGIRDISKRMNTKKYVRLRVGVGGPATGDNMIAHVLGRFHANETREMQSLLDFVSEILRVHIFRGFNAAGTIANTWTLDDFKRTSVARSLSR